MHRVILEAIASENPTDFENIRFHTINYVLNKGELVMGSSIERGHRRPDYQEGEYGVVMGLDNDNLIYAFRVDPLVGGNDRGLQIVVMGKDPEALDREAENLGRNTDLRIRS